MTSISKDFSECNLRSHEVIEALKSGNQAVIDQVASKIYANMLSVECNQIQHAPNWPEKDEKLKSVLHNLVEVFGGLLKIDGFVEQVQQRNVMDPKSTTDLAYELKFLLLDLLAIYNELNYSTWNLIDLFTPDHLKEEEIVGLIKPAVHPPPDLDLLVAQAEKPKDSVLKQTLTNWQHWCERYKTLLIRTYDAKAENTTVAFHGLLATAAQLVSASHMTSLLLFCRARSSGAKSLDRAR